MAPTIWPHAVGDAIEARIIHWDGNRPGVSYTYRNDDAEMHPIDRADWQVIRRLQSKGRLTYASDEVRALAAELPELNQ
jgi:hypothetical protein